MNEWIAIVTVAIVVGGLLFIAYESIHRLGWRSSRECNDTKAGRASKLGLPLACKKCDEGAPPDRR